MKNKIKNENLRSLKNDLAKAGLDDRAAFVRCGTLAGSYIERALKALYSDYVNQFEGDKRKKITEKEAVFKKQKDRSSYKFFTLGEMVGFLKTSNFLFEWFDKFYPGSKTKGRARLNNYLANLDDINQIRNFFVHLEESGIRREPAEELRDKADLLVAFYEETVSFFFTEVESNSHFESGGVGGAERKTDLTLIGQDGSKVDLHRIKKPPHSNVKTFATEFKSIFSPTKTIFAIIILATIITFYVFSVTWWKTNSPSPAKNFPGFSSNIRSFENVAYKTQISTSEEPIGAASILARKVEGTNSEWRAVENGENLSSRNPYRLLFYPTKQSYWYVIQIDTNGAIEWLYPKNPASTVSSGRNPTHPNKWITIPNENEAFFLDENVGIEHVYFISTQKKFEELENFLKTPRSPSEKKAPIQVALNFKTRGVGGKITVPTVPDYSSSISRDSTNQTAREIFQGEDGVLVIEKWFHHVQP